MGQSSAAVAQGGKEDKLKLWCMLTLVTPVPIMDSLGLSLSCHEKKTAGLQQVRF
jgi:hypothetical protein